MATLSAQMVPPYEERDVRNILKYYAQYETAPQFYTFADVDRSKLDVGKIAQYIWNEDMGQRKKTEYVDSIWDSNDDNMLRLFFGRKLYFLRQLDIELMKISHSKDIFDEDGNVNPEQEHWKTFLFTRLESITLNWKKLFVQRPLRMQRMQMDFTAVQNVVKKIIQRYISRLTTLSL